MKLLDCAALDAAYDDAYDMPDNSPYLAHRRALMGVQRAAVARIVAWMRGKAEQERGDDAEWAEGFVDEVLDGLADDLEAQAKEK